MIKDKLYFLTILYLTLPLVIFILGWLKPELAIPIVSIIIVSGYLVLKNSPKVTMLPADTPGRLKIILIFTVLFIWTMLSGTGGIFGYQNSDFATHNGRLHDLITYSWPIVLSSGQTFIYYFAYYLPGALLGKIIGYETASVLMLAWTFAGIMLLSLWIFRLLKIKPSWIIILVFIFFSGLDALGYMLSTGEFFLGRGIKGGKDGIEYWARGQEFLGYNSNTFLLYWSPHHALGGWLTSALLFFEVVRKKRVANIIFIWVLSILWSPFVTVGLLPFVGYGLAGNFRRMFSFQNIFGAGSVVLVLVPYFLAGSPFKNPQGWIWQQTVIVDFWPHLALFYLLEFGLYGLIAFDYWEVMTKEFRHFFLLALLVLLALPIYSYGFYNDLMLRASIPALFFLFLAVSAYIINKGISFKTIVIKNSALKLLFVLLLIGSCTAVVEIARAGYNPFKRRPPTSIVDFGFHSYQFLGSSDAFFYKYMAK